MIAVGTTVVAGVVGRHYATDFSLPGTESQHVVDLLNNEFPAQSGDVDTIVWHTANQYYFRGYSVYDPLGAGKETFWVKAADVLPVKLLLPP